MKVTGTIVVCLVLVLAAASSLTAGEKVACSQQAPDSQVCDATKLLAGVVHLSDDDVRFRTTGGTVIFVDPVHGPDDKLVVGSGYTKPDLILITHRHGDHFQPGVVKNYLKLNPDIVIAGPNDVVAALKSKSIGASPVVPGQEYTMAGIDFGTVPAYFEDPANGHPKEKGWVGYVLKLDGARYYVTGDTGPLPEMADIHPDVIFPLLAGCGGNLEQAVKMAELSKAGIVVPVHFHSGSEELAPAAEETVQKYIARLPKGVLGAYYKDAKLVTGSATAVKEKELDK